MSKLDRLRELKWKITTKDISIHRIVDFLISEELRDAQQPLGASGNCFYVEHGNAPLPRNTAPLGWKLVPIRPTEEMLLAYEAYSKLPYNPANNAQQYKAKHTHDAMLRAAPEPY